jgi:putative intracellular protease/amidase
MSDPVTPTRRASLLGAAAAAIAPAAGAAAQTAAVPAQRRVLFVVSNPAVAASNGMAIGYWLPELAHPWFAFQAKGYAMTVASPRGGQVVHDEVSAPDGRFGNPLDVVSRGFAATPQLQAILAETRPLAEMRVEDHDAIFVVGGLAPPTTFTDDERLHRLFAAFYEAGKVAAALCHGSLVLLRTRLSDGRLLAEGRRWTGYTNAEEDVVDRVFGTRFQPYRIEDEARKIADTQFVQGPPYRPFAVADGRLITGQQGSSGMATAELVIKALEG